MMLCSVRLKIFTFIAEQKLRRLALFIFLRQESREDATDRKLNRFAPVAELVSETIACGCCSERDQNIATETLHPAIVDRANTMGVGPFGFEAEKKREIDPLRLCDHPCVLRRQIVIHPLPLGDL